MKLSIVMPSHRNFGDSRIAIDSAKLYCEDRVELIVSDNSGDINKKNAYPWLLNSPPCGMIENWKRGFEASTGDFVLMMGDDDRIVGLNDIDLEIDKNVVGLRPAVMAFTPQHGIVKADVTEINAKTALDRVKQQTELSVGTNLAYFTFWRRDVLASIFDLWFNHHPMKGSYCDWAAVNALVSSGTVVRDPTSVYFYDISNWVGDQAFVLSQIDKAYVASGVPKEAAIHERLVTAIDSYIFINRKDSPVPDHERREAGMYCLGGRTFDEIIKTLDSFGVGDKYREFYKHAIGREWGE